MRKIIRRFAIPVPRSAEAMVIPDPTGTLEEGEIQFRFSGDRLVDLETRLKLTHVPEGYVLVTRIRACCRPTFASGGDYDGDLIRVFWEPELVVPFQNSDVSYADCPFEISEVFDKSDTTVADFVTAHGHKDKNERDTILIKELVAGAFQPAVRGLYGAMQVFREEGVL
ncbi:hypothetical protein NDA16_000792 [Ustilago loliicola]|nr:hypothetical protein NDA16_000792 [Ustilago loliicola]